MANITLPVAVGVAAFLVPTVVGVPQAHAAITPGASTITAQAGSKVSETVNISIPKIPKKADIEIAIDTTASMAPTLEWAKGQAHRLVSKLSTWGVDANFAVVSFRDMDNQATEHVISASNTGNVRNVHRAISALTAARGWDSGPAAQNYVMHMATTVVPHSHLWRSETKRILVMITDSVPYDAATRGFRSCRNTTKDPHRRSTKSEIHQLLTSETTLFALTPDPAVQRCYQDIVAQGFPGSAALPLSADVAPLVVDAIQDTSVVVRDLKMTIGKYTPNASWIRFRPPSTSRFRTPTSVRFSVDVRPPVTAHPGRYHFDLVATSSAGVHGHHQLTVVVPW